MEEQLPQDARIDEYLETSNEHWNEFAYKVHSKCVQEELFAEPGLPLEWIDKGIESFLNGSTTPSATLSEYLKQLSTLELSLEQKHFITYWLCDFIENSDFDVNVSGINKLLKSEVNRLERLTKGECQTTDKVRISLKQIVAAELSELPVLLHNLEPEKRLSILCKLLPFVLPKVESVQADSGESRQWLPFFGNDIP